jgi:O-antigen/teichoic acid export membrane protein
LGIYALSVATVLTVQEFLRLNIAMGLVKFGAQFIADNKPEKVAGLFKYGILLSAGSIATSVIMIGILVSTSYSVFFKTEGLQALILLFAIANGLSFFDAISRAALRLYFKFRINSMLQITMDILEFSSIALTLAIYGADLEAFFISVIVAKTLNSAVCNTAAYVELRKELPELARTPISSVANERSAFHRFILGNSLSSSIKVFMNQGDVLLLGLLGTTIQVGYYTTAKKLAYSVLSVTDPLTSSIFPQFSHLVAEKAFARIRTMLRTTTRILLPIALALLSLGFLIRGELVRILFGVEFAGSAMPFFILLISALQGSVFFWSVPLMQSLGLIRKRLWIHIFAVILGGLVALLLINEHQANGVAVGLLCANLFITAMLIRLSLKRMKLTA